MVVSPALQRGGAGSTIALPAPWGRRKCLRKRFRIGLPALALPCPDAQSTVRLRLTEWETPVDVTVTGIV
jgi:hypothetical protein